MKTVVVFGCGLGGKRFLKLLEKGESVAAFVDNDPKKQGTSFLGYDIVAPEAAVAMRFDSIVIASQYSDAITKQLLELGVKSSKIEIVSREFLAGKDAASNSSWVQFRIGTALWLAHIFFKLVGIIRRATFRP